jgi:hypothetical protein
VPHIRLNLDAKGLATVEVTGLPEDDLSRLERAAPGRDEWIALLRIEVAAGEERSLDRPAVLGAYAVSNGTLRFTPQFPFDPGQRYDVVLNPAVLPPAQQREAQPQLRPIRTTVRVPAPERAPTTRVVEVYPTSAELPENQLRMYVAFSAPMGLASGSAHVRLLDERAVAVADPFLPLDVDLWNEDRTRYTLLFDPGRVKRGILPNEEMGRSLIAGRTYTLVVDAEWRDAAGLPLVAAFRREFRAAAPQEHAIDPGEWHLEVPLDGTRDPLRVSFPRPLDFGLLHRAIRVSSEKGDAVEGAIDVQGAETRWIFTPRDPWQPGHYRLVAASTLEDVAGNRIGRPFEVEAFNRGPSVQKATGAALPFRIQPARSPSQP